MRKENTFIPLLPHSLACHDTIGCLLVRRPQKGNRAAHLSNSCTVSSMQMLSRYSTARILVPFADSLTVTRPTLSLYRNIASYGPLTQAAIPSDGSIQTAQEPPRKAVNAARSKQGVGRTLKQRLAKAKPHYVNPLKPRVSIRTKNGRELTFNINPTPKANVEKLTEAVTSLCSWPADYGQEPKVHTVGQPQWSLTKNGDGVFRLLAVKSSNEGDEIASRIQRVADEMNHHPTIISLKPEGSHTPLHMCVINTTHHPRGLSMRDIRLALAVDSILQDYDVERPVFDTTHEQAATILQTGEQQHPDKDQ